VDEVVKIKSITSQETDLNEYLEEQGIAAWETDLAELIVQLGHDRPSHIVVPAIHRNRAEVREIFLHEMKNYGRPAP
ncbi:(4Fe-4S)-binding protein, partial [Streptococcus pneumoniae]|nr:(4Fe-4S)-binding protein [Streptococcus pneumoniae]